jgi:hypothetical protein
MRLLLPTRLFWLGLVGLIGLLWSWRVSSHEGHVAVWATSGRGLFVSQGGGTIRVGTDNAALKNPGFAVSKWVVPMGGDERWYDAVKLDWEEFGHGTRIDSWRLRVSHWLVVVVYGVVWMGSTVWWVRRRDRLMEAVWEGQGPRE